MRIFLHKVAATLTGCSRQVTDDIGWSGNWTHKVFRSYEYVFGRRDGIKFEGATTKNGGKELRVFGTWENLLSYTENVIRNFKLIPGFQIVRVPQLALPGGSSLSSPFSFAIASDATSTPAVGNSLANLTVTHTITGSNTILFGSTWDESGLASDATTGTYNSVLMTSAATSFQSGEYGTTALYLVAPTSGANTLSITRTATGSGYDIAGISYSGAKQTGQPDATSSTRDTATTTVTTVANNCWVAIFIASNAFPITASSGFTVRINLVPSTGQSGRGIVGDAGPKTPAGSVSMTSAGGSTYGTVMVSFAPAIAATIVHSLMSLGMGA